MDDVPMEWEPLFDIGCISGRPLIPRDDREEPDSGQEVDERGGEPDKKEPADDGFG